MHWEQQKELFDDMVLELNNLLIKKGKEYASDADALANFKTASDIGVTPLQKALIFAEKHWFSIKSYVKRGKELSNEPIEGRIHDMINYLFLILCLIKEYKQEMHTKPFLILSDGVDAQKESNNVQIK